ncbi:MAG: DUF4826 family protein [Paraglaciecola sp.]|nr:DUF4826 family protein [Paraglaciecola sp.]
MSRNTEKPNSKEIDAWVKKNLNTSVYKFINRGTIDDPIVEAKPAWVLPFQILLGKIRAKSHPEKFTWVICGDLPTDYVESSVASTPKEVARHFSFKWQLTASKFQDKNIEQPPSQIAQDDVAKNLISHAEALYELVENEHLWQLPDNT